MSDKGAVTTQQQGDTILETKKLEREMWESIGLMTSVLDDTYGLL
jgi:hypothetical protein